MFLTSERATWRDDLTLDFSVFHCDVGTTATILLLSWEWSQCRNGRWKGKNQGCTWHFGLLNQSSLQTALILDLSLQERIFSSFKPVCFWDFKYSNWQSGSIHFIGLLWKLNRNLWSVWKLGSTRSWCYYCIAPLLPFHVTLHVSYSWQWSTVLCSSPWENITSILRMILFYSSKVGELLYA